MIKTAAIFVCENCLIDKRDTVSVIGIFGKLSAEKLPFKYPFWVYAYIRGWVGSHTMSVSYKDPEGVEHDIDELLINLHNPKFSQTYVERLEKELNQYGEYTFCLYLDKELVAEYYVNLSPVDDKE